MEPSSSKILKKYLDPEQPSLADPACTREDKFNDPQRAIPASPILCCYGIVYAFKGLKFSQGQFNGESMCTHGHRGV